MMFLSHMTPFVWLYSVFSFKLYSAYEILIGGWSSDVCSSDVRGPCQRAPARQRLDHAGQAEQRVRRARDADPLRCVPRRPRGQHDREHRDSDVEHVDRKFAGRACALARSEERRVGKECVSTCSYRRAPVHSTKKPSNTKSQC